MYLVTFSKNLRIAGSLELQMFPLVYSGLSCEKSDKFCPEIFWSWTKKDFQHSGVRERSSITSVRSEGGGGV